MPAFLYTALFFVLQPHHHAPVEPGHWWTHWIWMIVWVVLLILLVVWIVRAVTARGRNGRTSARDVLERRYAEGEISTEEYEERKRRL